jgi:PAS domain S-box-containing protein
MSEGVVVHGPQGQIVAANPSAERILGMTLDQMAGRTPLDPSWRLTRPDGQPVTQDDIPSEITARTGRPCRNVILRVVRGSGEPAWLTINTDLVPDEHSGKPRLVVATFTDITAEVEARAELTRSRAHFQRLIEAAPGVIYQYLLGPDGEESFPFVSPRAADVFGVPADAILRDPGAAWSRIHPEDVPALRESVQRSAQQLTAWEPIFRAVAPDGGWRWLRSHAMPERTPDGTLWTGVVLDVTS